MIEKREETSDDGFVENVGLTRQVGLFSGIALQVGGIIGSGIFISPKFVALYGGSTGVILLIWTFCGLFALLSGLCLLELALAFPNLNGADYSYITEAFGPMPSFVCSYLLVFLQRPAVLAMICLTCGEYILVAFGVVDVLYTKLLASGLIIIILVLNCLSVKWAFHVQKLMLVLKLIPVVMIVVTGIVRLAQGYTESFIDPFKASSISISGIGFGIYAGLWSYGGIDNFNYAMKEIVNPYKNVPIIVWVSIPTVTICYVLVNIGYLSLLLPEEVASTNATAVVFAKQLFGVMAWTVPAFVACSTFGAANTVGFTGSRLIYAVSGKGHLPQFLRLVHRTRNTPWMAVLFYCVTALILLIPPSSNFGTLLGYLVFSGSITTSTTLCGLLWLRHKKPHLDRPYKVFIGFPIFVLSCSIFLVVAPFYNKPIETSIGLAFNLLGIPLYFAFVKYKILPSKVYLAIDTFTKHIGEKTNSSIPNEDPLTLTDEPLREE